MAKAEGAKLREEVVAGRGGSVEVEGELRRVVAPPSEEARYRLKHFTAPATNAPSFGDQTCVVTST